MENGTKVALAFLVGGAIGAGVALLYAPQTGYETRRDLSRAAKRLQRDSMELVDETVENVNDFVANLREKTADIMDRGVDLSDNAKKEILKTYEYGQKLFAKQKDKLVDALGIAK